VTWQHEGGGTEHPKLLVCSHKTSCSVLLRARGVGLARSLPGGKRSARLSAESGVGGGGGGDYLLSARGRGGGAVLCRQASALSFRFCQRQRRSCDSSLEEVSSPQVLEQMGGRAEGRGGGRGGWRGHLAPQRTGGRSASWSHMAWSRHTTRTLSVARDCWGKLRALCKASGDPEGAGRKAREEWGAGRGSAESRGQTPAPSHGG